jgi:predicted Zn-dependent peptidase
VTEPAPVSLDTAVERRIESEITPLPAAFLAWHAPELRNEELKCLELLAMILADGDSSRLTLSMEYDRQIASETGAWVEEGEGCSIFHLYAVAGSVETRPEELRSQLLAELRRVVEDGITNRELEKVRNRKQSNLLASLASISTRTERLAWYATIFDNPGLVWNEAKEYESIIPDQIVEAARDYLLEAKFASVLYHTL